MVTLSKYKKTITHTSISKIAHCFLFYPKKLSKSVWSHIVNNKKTITIIITSNIKYLY